MSETKTRRQSINFLGFLRSQLSGLQGIPTLCYELIQNADDVKDINGNPGGASRITFDVCDDALYVENDGVFREIDFERMENVSWGNKREEAETTGAFGIGFISVYQITDSPEIYSSGQHWQFQPQAQEDERILINEEETQFTRFRLPWAYEMSQVRQELGIPPVRKDQLALYTHQLIGAIGKAALFLKQVHILEVKRSGEIFCRIEVLKGGDWLLLNNGKQTTKWHILEGDFKPGAEEMRTEYGKLIEEKRRSVVQMAIPEEPLKNGLLYAFLPSETSTGLPFHINADFYPSSDRKRILLETDFKSEWNNLAIECAAETLSVNLDRVLEIFSDQIPVFWDFIAQIRHASVEAPLESVFENFWEKIKPPIREMPTVITTSKQMVVPSEAVYLDSEEQKKASMILEDLGISTAHPDLRSHRNLLVEVGTRLLRVADIAEALQNKGIDKRTELVNMPAKLRSKAGWTKFWSALNNLWNGTSYIEKRNAEIILKDCAIAFGSDGALWPPAGLYQADTKTRKLFSKFSSIIWFVQVGDAETLPTCLVPEFVLNNGLEVIEQVQATLPEAWKSGAFSPQEIHDWLELHRPEIARNSSMQETIRSLAIWPNSNGELQPLESLYVAGDFEDPLHLAQLIDINALGGRHEFLENELGVNQLDFVTYVRGWLPTAFETAKLDQKNRFQLLKILAENLGKLQGQKDLQEILYNLPLVWCGDDIFLTAPKVYFDSKEVRNVLGKEIPYAHLPAKKSDAIRVLYEWLGVVKEPLPEDIVTYIHTLVSIPPQPTNLKSIKEIFSYLANKWDLWGEEKQDKFRQLMDEKWLPGSKSHDEWFAPIDVYAIYRKFIFESQGNFLEIDLKVQQKGSDLIKFLNINIEPSIVQVVKHLLYCSERKRPITQEVYVFLTQKADNPAIQVLVSKKCLYLKLPSGDEEYFFPNQVYWEQHPFGSYRARLGTEFGRFKDLFDKLGVKEKPNENDAIAVLQEIAEKVGKSDIQFEDDSDTGKIVIMCWKLINSALENDQIKPATIKKALGNKETILSSRHTLDFPIHLFFDDRAGLGQKFQFIKNNLTRAIEGAWMAMEAAGVQRLSKVITTELLQCDNPNRDIVLETRLTERIPLILRVIEYHRSKGFTDFDVNRIKELSFSKTDRIIIVRVFNGLGCQERSLPEEVNAIHLEGELNYCSVDDNYPWQSIARELAYVLHPSGELSSLGLELKEILSQSVHEASGTLDEYGYPRVDQGPDEVTDGPVVTPGTKKEPPGISTDGGSEELDKGDGRGSTGGSDGDKKKKRSNSWLRSYVVPPDEGDNGGEPKPVDSDWASHRTETGKKGVARVMKYEIEHGRSPTDMETIQPNHPGYDIKSVDEKGQTRYIEVKSFSGIWDRQNPAQMSKKEFDDARDWGGSYWLYVVEKVETDNYKIYRICNPANRADHYLFDDGWQPLSE
jgi:hypothetical protein